MCAYTRRLLSKLCNHTTQQSGVPCSQAERRVRALSGLKRYYHRKRQEGLLSSYGLRMLDNACAQPRSSRPCLLREGGLCHRSTL
jgi:hypothetical protein